MHPDAARTFGRDALLYDLFAVANHLGGRRRGFASRRPPRNPRIANTPAPAATHADAGGMTGGHYTAFVRAVPCSKDGAEEVAGTFGDAEAPWLHVDDDVVEEASPAEVVTLWSVPLRRALGCTLRSRMRGPNCTKWRLGLPRSQCDGPYITERSSPATLGARPGSSTR